MYDKRLNLAKTFGASHTINSKTNNAKEEILKIQSINKDKNLIRYDEKQILDNSEIFYNDILSKSLFEKEKIIIINRATDKIVNIITDLLEKDISDISIIINSNNLEIIYADLNQGRLSSYNRLDIAIKKHVEINKTTTLDFTARCTNLYNRQNIFYVDRVTTDKVYQLPLLPSLGISCKF